MYHTAQTFCTLFMRCCVLRFSSGQCYTYHYSDVIMTAMASQIIGVSVVCSTFCLGTDQRNHQSSASLAFLRGFHRWPVISPHKGPVTRKMFPFDDVIVLFAVPFLTLGQWHEKQLLRPFISRSFQL